MCWIKLQILLSDIPKGYHTCSDSSADSKGSEVLEGELGTLRKPHHSSALNFYLLKKEFFSFIVHISTAHVTLPSFSIAILSGILKILQNARTETNVGPKVQSWAWHGNMTGSPQKSQSSPVLAGCHCWSCSLDSYCSLGQEEMGKETSSKWENISITQFWFL